MRPAGSTGGLYLTRGMQTFYCRIKSSNVGVWLGAEGVGEVVAWDTRLWQGHHLTKGVVRFVN